MAATVTARAVAAVALWRRRLRLGRPDLLLQRSGWCRRRCGGFGTWIG
jgi:hypothetical protein